MSARVLKSFVLASLMTLAMCQFMPITTGQHHHSLAGPGGSTATRNCGTDSSSKLVTFTTSGSSLQVQSTGCPGYDWTSASTGFDTRYQCYTNNLPANPIINTAHYVIGTYLYKNGTGTNASPAKGALGFAINGVPLYSNSDAENRDAYVYEGTTFDQCKGHADPSYQYHYHTETKDGCVTTQVAGQHSPLFGIMADGIPLYGTLGDGGVAPTDLDECNGHTDSTYPFYHYHITPSYTYPYLINCLKGCLNGTTMLGTNVATCVPQATQYDYSSVHTVLSGLSSTSYTCSKSAASALDFNMFVLAAAALASLFKF
eukprot:GILK01006560.1.p1 GENE.GILK01006560.1~~GILK01006560.1.p1  ORF type:complete len:329 (-),score=14.22 GILK01006560.1:143-1087(-)